MGKDMSFWEGLRQGWDLGIEEGTEDGIRESIGLGISI